MTKDFAKSTSKERSSKERNSRNNRANNEASTSLPVKPFFTGTFFGICLCLGIQWFLQQDSGQAVIEPLTETLNPNAVTAPVLTFYKDLREVEVMVPESSTEPAEEEHVEYLLQAGSFKDPKDADSLRAQLILLNMTTEIRKFNHNGELYHRVFVGPFPTKSNTSKARTTLRENGIDSLTFTQTVKG